MRNTRQTKSTNLFLQFLFLFNTLIMEFKKILVTPEVAQHYLQSNTKNRNVNEKRVAKYANDMARGKWKEDTGECIKVSKTGILLDGQHRLHGVVKANTNIYMGFIFNLDDSVFDVIDTGGARNPSDIFKIEGIKNAALIPSTISFARFLIDTKTTERKHKVTNSDALEIYRTNPEYWQDSAKNSTRLYHACSRIMTPTWIGGFGVFFGGLDEDMGKRFMDQLCTGNDVENSTINVLRQKLTQDKMSIKRINKRIKLAFFLKTWNAFVNNKTLKILKFDQNKETFPVAIAPFFKLIK